MKTNNIIMDYLTPEERGGYVSLEVETFDGKPDALLHDVELRRLAIENRLLREEIARLK